MAALDKLLRSDAMRYREQAHIYIPSTPHPISLAPPPSSLAPSPFTPIASRAYRAACSRRSVAVMAA